MAEPNWEQYARSYGGTASPEAQGGAAVGAGLNKAFGAIPKVEDRIRMNEADSISTALSGLSNFYTKDVASWTDLDDDIPGAGKAFMNLKDGADSALTGRQKRVAKRKGLLNPVDYIQKYNAQRDMMVPLITKKLKAYQVSNKRSNAQMRQMFDKLPNLRTYLMSNISEVEQADFPYLVPKEYATETLNRWADEFGTPGEWSLGEAMWKGPVSVTPPGIAYQTGKVSKKLLNFATEKFGMKEGKAKDVIAEGGELAGTIGAGIGLKTIVPAISKAIAKKGIAGTIKKVVKGLGMRKAAGILTKLGIGSVGGVLTGGALTAAMGAMALKDIYDIYSIIVEE